MKNEQFFQAIINHRISLGLSEIEARDEIAKKYNDDIGIIYSLVLEKPVIKRNIEKSKARYARFAKRVKTFDEARVDESEDDFEYLNKSVDFWC